MQTGIREFKRGNTMNFTMHSRRLNKDLTFWLVGQYIYVNLNGRSGFMGNQICKGGYHDLGDTLTANEANFKKVCKNWLRLYYKTILNSFDEVSEN